MKNASAFAFRVGGRGARTGKNAVVSNIPMPMLMIISNPIAWAREVSALSVDRRPPPTIKETQANHSCGRYFPDFATLIPKIMPNGIVAPLNASSLVPEPIGDANLHA